MTDFKNPDELLAIIKKKNHKIYNLRNGIKELQQAILFANASISNLCHDRAKRHYVDRDTRMRLHVATKVLEEHGLMDEYKDQCQEKFKSVLD